MSGEVIMPGLADFIERWDEQERAARERLAGLAAKPLPEGGTVVYEIADADVSPAPPDPNPSYGLDSWDEMDLNGDLIGSWGAWPREDED